MARRKPRPWEPLDEPRAVHPTEDAQKSAFPPGTPRLATRRDALVRGGQWALAAGVFSAGIPLLHDEEGRAGLPAERTVRLPAGGYAVADDSARPQLVIVHGHDPLAMITAGLRELGGAARFVTRGDRVIIKPNVAFDRSPPLGATSNPAVVAAAVRIFRGEGAEEVRVLDNPINSPEGCFHRSGVGPAALEAGARVILPTPDQFRLLEVPGASLIVRWPMMYRPFMGVQRVVGIAPLKDHNLCSASMTMKNWYGLLGGRRNQFHQRIHDIVSELAMMMRPTLVILDATRVLMRNGPTGGSLADVKAMDTLVLATDQLAADAYAYEMLLGRDPATLPYLELAEKKGAGTRLWRDVRRREITA